LNWSKGMRQTHRWLSIVFTVAVIVNGVTVVRGKYNTKLGLSAVFVLALLLFTGLYLFVLPYAAKWRSARRSQSHSPENRGRAGTHDAHAKRKSDLRAGNIGK
jgi:uncharacterized iron-regulated membrane protein